MASDAVIEADDTAEALKLLQDGVIDVKVRKPDIFIKLKFVNASGNELLIKVRCQTP